MKKSWMILVIFVFLFAFLSFIVSATESLGTFKQGEEIRISLNCYNATYFNVSSITYPNSSIAISDTQLSSFGNGEWNMTFDLTEDKGLYHLKAISDGCENTFDYSFKITSNGEEANYSYLIATLILILTFTGFGILIYKDKEKMNDEKYWNLMVSRWKDKNYLRFSAAVLWYNLKKNSYILQYLIGLVIMIMVYDITAVYNLDAISSVFRILLGLYTLGSLLVVIVLFGSVQEWLKEWQEELAKINWGAFESGK